MSLFGQPDFSSFKADLERAAAVSSRYDGIVYGKNLETEIPQVLRLVARVAADPDNVGEINEVCVTLRGFSTAAAVMALAETLIQLTDRDLKLAQAHGQRCTDGVAGTVTKLIEKIEGDKS